MSYLEDKENYERTGRITDPLHNWNTLSHSLKVWQRVSVVIGVCIQTSLLILSVVFLCWGFF